MEHDTKFYEYLDRETIGTPFNLIESHGLFQQVYGFTRNIYFKDRLIIVLPQREFNYERVKQLVDKVLENYHTNGNKDDIYFTIYTDLNNMITTVVRKMKIENLKLA